MTSQSKPRISHNLLSAMSYLVIVGVAVPILIQSFGQNHPQRWITLGLMAALAVMVILRDRGVFESRTRCFVYTTVQTGLIAALALMPPGASYAVILFFMLSAEVTMLYPQRIGFAWLAVFTVVTLVVLLALQGGEGLLILPIYVGGYFFFAAFAMQTAQADTARKRSEALLAELQVAHEQLQEYAAQAEQLAVSEERNRLAREMHDTLGHRLTVAAVQLQAAERLVPADPDRSVQMIGTVREQVREALQELRRAVATLRAPLEADLALPTSLKRLSASFQQATGIVVHLELPEQLADLPESHRLALYRAAQEGLTNIQRHAGASEAWLRLIRENGQITLDVEDNGSGIDPDSSGAGLAGFGLHGLRERAAHLGGLLVLDSRPTGGARLVMTLPLPQENLDA